MVAEVKTPENAAPPEAPGAVKPAEGTDAKLTSQADPKGTPEPKAEGGEPDPIEALKAQWETESLERLTTEAADKARKLLQAEETDGTKTAAKEAAATRFGDALKLVRGNLTGEDGAPLDDALFQQLIAEPLNAYNTSVFDLAQEVQWTFFSSELLAAAASALPEADRAAFADAVDGKDLSDWLPTWAEKYAVASAAAALPEADRADFLKDSSGKKVGQWLPKVLATVRANGFVAGQKAPPGQPSTADGRPAGGKVTQEAFQKMTQEERLAFKRERPAEFEAL